MQKRDLMARIIGLIVFALGIAILVVSFAMAYKLFTSAEIAAAAAQPGGPSATVNLSRSALYSIISIGALFIMVLAGSVIAGRGVQMYFAGERPPMVEE